jgi:hypothetical protein
MTWYCLFNKKKKFGSPFKYGTVVLPLYCMWHWFISPAICLLLLSCPWCQTLQLVIWVTASNLFFSLVLMLFKCLCVCVRACMRAHAHAHMYVVQELLQIVLLWSLFTLSWPGEKYWCLSFKKGICLMLDHIFQLITQFQCHLVHLPVLRALCYHCMWLDPVL